MANDVRVTPEAAPPVNPNAEANAKLVTIKVKSSLKKGADGGDPVALWERDEAHPDGECLVRGDKPVDVGETARVQRLIASGVLVKA